MFEKKMNRYASVKAIERKSLAEAEQWLTYWVLYAIISLFELIFSKLLEWLVFNLITLFLLYNKLRSYNYNNNKQILFLIIHEKGFRYGRS